MSKGLTGSQIPYIKACNGKRWNPIEGCSNTPDICAVRGMGLCWAENIACPKAKTAKEYGEVSYDCEGNNCLYRMEGFCFPPTFHSKALEAPLRTRKPYVIFTGFGGDMWSDGVDPDWRRQVFEVERACPQHVFVHLTKCPDWMIGDHIAFDDLPNAWFGVSITGGCSADLMRSLWMQTLQKNHLWVSFEPVLDDILVGSNLLQQDMIEFIVIGGLSDGNGKVVSPEDGGTRAEWIQPILDAAYDAKIPVFMKNIDRIWRQIVNPRTGKPLQSPYEIRDIPSSWYESEVAGFNR